MLRKQRDDDDETDNYNDHFITIDNNYDNDAPNYLSNNNVDENENDDETNRIL